ncbi:FtsX-like permease family protein [Terracoccus luteus]|uniref:ABC3 transporter permease C-terminal domain-containing protein n=1 Tax=Terracoccus luteus TaxID=53356 RepID=A0A839PW30_9MICO|nr:FtsX-like permease family protein [Terracoccus luteus]MBB2986196.1 hypothetical protein [Terracoccus luteus]MCP2172214.1 hypothetical protein [Terracoccus luteus]
MRAALQLSWRLRAAGARENRTPGALAVIAFAVATAALLVCLGGLGAFTARAAQADTALAAIAASNAGAGPDLPSVDDLSFLAEMYVTLAWVATTCMVVPILTLGGVAARLAIARRDQRLAALRLAGATSAQVTVMTLAEAALQALLGALGGVVLYAAALPLVARLEFQATPFELRELVVPVWQLLAVVAGVVVLAMVSGLSSLARVVVSPLGVAARTTPKRLSLLRVVVAAVAVGAWVLVISPMDDPEAGNDQRGLIVLLLGGLILAVNTVGPFVVMLVGRLVARFAPTAPVLLAARRIVDDPRSTWRAVGALGLAIIIVGFTNVVSAAERQSGPDAVFTADLRTGALVTLTVITIVGATSTGVVQASRVLDQRAQYRSLSLAGTSLRTLHRARTVEVALPLVVTVVVSAGFALAVVAPFASAQDAGLVTRFAVAVTAASGLMLASVLASRSLVRQAALAG